MTTIIRLLKDKRGASAAEYGLLLATIGAVIAVAALGLSTAIGNSMNDTAACLDTPNSNNC